jgi:1-phosphofructokinase
MDLVPKITTVTLNPAIDETVLLDGLLPGVVNRATGHHRQPGGKGINISSMLGGYGIPTIATGFLGRENTGIFEQLFVQQGIRDEFIRIDGNTRTGIKIVSQSHRETTDINFPGLQPCPSDFRLLLDKLATLVHPGYWFVVAGSLPAGFSVTDFKELLLLLKHGGAKIAVDTSGTALRAAIDCGVDLIKPNHHELAEILSLAPDDLASIIAGAANLQQEKVPHVLLSLGADGAMFFTPEESLTAKPPPVDVVSTVGAGDSLLAGYLAGMVTGLSATDCAKLATVFAWNALESIERRAPSHDEAMGRMPAIQVETSAR